MIAPGEAADVSIKNKELYLRLPGLKLHAYSLTLVPEQDAVFSVEVTDGAEERTPLHYVGRLQVTVDVSSTLMLVNTVPLDEYVASVVGSEYGFDDLEGAKAMAVIIRSYALKTLGRHGDGYDQVDHNGSQVYSGYDAIKPVDRDATEQTRGEVLTYRGELVEAVYFASSGGHTASNEDVWMGTPLPYLRGKKDPYDASPYASWSITLPRKKVLKTLAASAGFKVSGFRIGKKSPDGRVQTIYLLKDGKLNTDISANDFRLWIIRDFGAQTLKSTLFTARVRGKNYEFDGHGYGHGVGLSQWGAHEMALKGRKYKDILNFYYTDVSLEREDHFASLLPSESDSRRLPPPGPPVTTEQSPPVEKPVIPARPKRTRRLGW